MAHKNLRASTRKQRAMNYKKIIVQRYEREQIEDQPLDLSMRNGSEYSVASSPSSSRASTPSTSTGSSRATHMCDCCGKFFVQSSSLRTHNRIHSGEKPFHCKDCGKCFGDQSTFTKHRRVHTKEQPYKCPVCAKKFSQSGNCLRHSRKIHGWTK